MPAASDELTVLYVSGTRTAVVSQSQLLDGISDDITAISVTSANEAFEELATGEIDCLLTVSDLPEVDGLQFLLAVRAEYPELPVIFFTDMAETELITDAVSAEVSDILDLPTHPDDVPQLADRIRLAVGKEHARRARLEKHEHAKRILEAAPDGVLVSVDEELVYANRAATSLLGGTSEELLGGDPAALTNTDADLWTADTEPPQDRLTRLRSVVSSFDGEQLDVELTTNEITWGDETGVVAILRDVTESATENRESALIRAQLEGLVDTISAAIFLKDTEGQYLLMNQRCREILGIDQSTDVVGLTDAELFDRNIADGYVADDRRVFEAGETIEIEETVPTVNGERTMLTRKTPIFDEMGDPFALCAVSTDITRQKERERALTERIKELSAIHRTVDLFESVDTPTEAVLSEFVEALPDSFQYPDSTAARVQYGHIAAATGGFEEGGPSLTATAETQNGPSLRIEVCCHSSVAEDDPFLTEEQSLLDTLATVIASYLERRRHLEELERYETTLRALGDPVYALDADGRFTFVNDALLEQTGYESEELLGEHTSVLLSEEDVERGREVVRELLGRADSETAKWEMELVTADGERIPAENHVALLPFDEDGFRGTAGVMRDVTERAEREQELERRKDLLVRTEQIADVGGWEIDTETGQLYWTEGTRLIHGVPDSYDPTLDDAIEFYHPEDRKQIEELTELCWQQGEPFDTELRIITAQGRERWVHVRGESVQESGGRKLRGTIQDITSTRENKQQLTVLNRVLRHNLRNNLNVVTANADLIRDQIEGLRTMTDTPTELRKQLLTGLLDESSETGLSTETVPVDDERIRDQLEAGLAAFATFPFDDVLGNIEQLEAKSWELLAIADKSRELAEITDRMERTEAIDLESLLQGLVEEFRMTYPAATLELETVSAEVEANSESIYLALEELLENAIKHAGPEPTVDITVRKPTTNRTEIRICDDGPGIPEIERQALEEGQETALKHGSGFGLWTVNWLLSRLGGTVHIDDVESGTVVRVELPAS